MLPTDAPSEQQVDVPFNIEQMEGIISAVRLRECLKEAEKVMEPTRAEGREYVDYFLGRVRAGGKDRPIDLLGQTLNAYCPKLCPKSLMQGVMPRRGGLGMEALAIKLLLEQDDEEEDICEQVYDGVISSAMFFPMGITYTGLRPKGEPMAEGDVDEGEPFTLGIEYADWLVDPFAKVFRQREYEGHRFRTQRRWLLKSPAYQDPETQAYLKGLEAWETNRGPAEASDKTGGAPSRSNESNSLFDTVELYNVVIYDSSGIYEVTLPVSESGTPRYLRAAKWTGPDGGPYDHLIFRRVPGLLIPLAILSKSFPLADATDMMFRKMIRSALASKKILVGRKGKEEEIDAMKEAEHGSALAIDEPGDAAVFDLDLNQAALFSIISQAQVMWNDVSGQARQLSGAKTGDKTATQADIRNAQASEQVAYLQNKIDGLLTKNSRKRAAFFITDPSIKATMAMQVKGGLGALPHTITLEYTASNRRGGVDDFTITTTAVNTLQTSPEIRAKRVLEALSVIRTEVVPLAQMGAIDFDSTVRFLDQTVAPGLSDIAGSQQLMQERSMAQRATQAAYSGGEQFGPSGEGGAPTTMDGPTTKRGMRDSVQTPMDAPSP